MIEIIFTRTYEKQAKKFFKANPGLKSQYAKILKLLAVNPQHPSLRLHKLKGKFQDLHSISVNYSHRIIIKFLIKENTIIPISINKHDRIY